MNTSDLEVGVRELDALSSSEYGTDLHDIMKGLDQNLALQRLSRLVGVAIKEPLAERREAPGGASSTGARYQWWLDQARFDRAAADGAWQLKVIETLKRDLSGADAYASGLSLFAFVDYAQSERGLFSWLSENVGKYICKDPAIRAKVETAFQDAIGTDSVSAPTPEQVVAAVGATVGTILTQQVPALSVAGPAAIAGLILILYARGVNAFCKWTKFPGETAHVTSELH